MSTKTGVPPALCIAPAVAKKVNGVVMISSPGLRSRVRIGRSSASVPLAHPTACLVWDRRATSASSWPDLRPHDEALALDDGCDGSGHIVLDAAVLRHQVQQRYVHRSRLSQSRTSPWTGAVKWKAPASRP